MVCRKNKCSKNINCHFHNGTCSLGIINSTLQDFIKKLCIEFYENNIKSMELLHVLNYYVSNIIDKKKNFLKILLAVIKII